MYKLAEEVVTLAKSQGKIITTAESCTGGLLGSALTAIPGSSDVFDCGFTTYSYESKTKILGVDANTIKTKGAVSKEVAEQMVKGAINNSRAHIAIAITGIAGPGGATPDKPVGLVYISTSFDGLVEVHEHHFKGDRQEVREQTTQEALVKLRDYLAKNNKLISNGN